MRFDGREEQLEILREIADNIADPVFLVDRQFNVWYFNRAFEAAVGIRMSSRRYRDRPCHELLGLSICKDNCVMKQAVETQQNVRLAEIPGINANGEDKNFHINAIPLINSEGVPFGSLNILRDITAETQIHEKYKQLVARNSAMSLSGTIENSNLVDVLQLFMFLQKSGRLLLAEMDALPNTHAGEILFEKGAMVSMRYGQVWGEKALDRFMAWEEGKFSFTPRLPEEIPHRVAKSSDFLLMDAVRERDEFAAKQHLFPAADALPIVLKVADAAEDNLSESEWMVFEKAVEGVEVAQMVEALTLSDSRIYLDLCSLRDKKILSW